MSLGKKIRLLEAGSLLALSLLLTAIFFIKDRSGDYIIIISSTFGGFCCIAAALLHAKARHGNQGKDLMM